MKVYLIGHKGWIGSMYIKEFNKQNIQWIASSFRAESKHIKNDILKTKSTHILCCIGRTHGVYEGIEYNTIDYLENKDTLYENINDNLFSPISLALFAKENNIHFTYFGTGCIFNSDSEDNKKFNENDKPNFKGSNYSIVKGFTDTLMKCTDALNLRIRMPITHKNNPRNFITKIINYEKICSMKNSMSVLDNLIPISIQMMKNKEIGTWNFTNPGVISHNEILELYKNIVDKDFTWNNFSIKEQSQILLADRSNNHLDTKKLESKYSPLSIKEAIIKTLQNWNK